MDKELIMKIAFSYVGTPHVNGGNIKGVGLDCCTLITNLYREIGYGTIRISFGYSGDWYLKYRCKELVLPYLEQHFDKVNELRVGDIISYRFGRSNYAHLSMYLGDNKVIHCSANNGVEIKKLNDSCFLDINKKSRISGFWRMKN